MSITSLYLHVPFCKHLCNYCDFYKLKLDSSKNQFSDFESYLLKSVLRLKSFHLDHSQSLGELETVYLGGGTPSLWGEQGSAFFKQLNFKLASNVEFTMEVDPGAWTEKMIESWIGEGLNRISLGTQSLNPAFLKILDRSHSLDESLELLRFCQNGNWNFSLDFLLGVPHSENSKRNIIEELKRFLDFSPKHVSLYILNARSKYPLIDFMPTDEYVRDEYLTVSRFLQEQGFHHYEVSNFALPGFESKHNLKYWNSEAVAALGPTGTGYLPQGNKAFRYKWKVSQADVDLEELTEDQVELERTYLELRTSLGWKPKSMTTALESLFTRWQSMGYGSLENGRMKLNAQGFVLLDSLMDDLFRL